jgi:hypothetical protein
LRETGASLAEVTVSLGLLGLLAAGLHQLTAGTYRTARVLEISGELRTAGRIAVETIEHDLRMAGFSASHRAGNGLVGAFPDRVELAFDLNGDGDSNDTNELVGYGFDEGRRTLTRKLGRSSPQPMLNDVDVDGLHFSYFDADGLTLHAGTEGLDAAARRRVQVVEVGLHLQVANPVPGGAPVRAHYDATVHLRNARPGG